MTLTVQELRKAAERTIPGKLHFSILMWQFQKPSYAEWVPVVEQAVMYQLTEMSQRRNDLHKMSEDQLSAAIVIALNNLTLEASGRVVNGNCDLSVSFDDYQWLGEAKIARDHTTIYGGYLQLTQRYTPGIPNQSAGAMLLYCTTEAAVPVIEGWKAVLAETVANSDIRPGDSPLTFRSSDVVGSTGLPVELLHIAFPLKYDPQEDKIKLPQKALNAGRAAKRAAKKRGSAEG